MSVIASFGWLRRNACAGKRKQTTLDRVEPMPRPTERIFAVERWPGAGNINNIIDARCREIRRYALALNAALSGGRARARGPQSVAFWLRDTGLQRQQLSRQQG
ncbi:MAG: hypothetical protein N2444_00770 [Methylocystis sp.]|nr:hypothetical protein [Methylocystis sp.]